MTMAKAHVELDFLGLLNDSSQHHQAASQLPPPQQPRLDSRRSFCGISKINPEIVKSVIASAANNKSSYSVPATPISDPTDFPVLNPPPPFPRPGNNEKNPETAPLTIFYKGTVSVFDLPKDKAEDIMKFAIQKSSSKTEGEVDEPASFNVPNTENILEALNDGDLPIKRKMSLQRFFEKRKERLISVSPYPTDHVKTSAQSKVLLAVLTTSFPTYFKLPSLF